MSDFLTQCLSCSIGITCIALFIISLTQFAFSYLRFPKIAMFWQLMMATSVVTAVFLVPAQANDWPSNPNSDQSVEGILVSYQETDE